MYILAKFNTLSWYYKLILKFNTFSILQILHGSPVLCNFYFLPAHFLLDTLRCGHLTAWVLMDFGENYSFHMQDQAQGYQMSILYLLLQVQLK